MSTSRLWKRAFSPNISRQSGFGLVEMMVAMVIGLIGTVVIFQVFAVSEGQRRSTMSGGDAQFNGSFSIFTMDRDIRMAGGGIARTSDVFGCTLSVGGATVAAPALAPAPPNPITVAPLVITDGGAGGSDSIKVMYGTGIGAQVSVALGGALPGTGTAVPISSQDNAIGFNKGDQVLAAQSGVNCSLGTVKSDADVAAAGPINLVAGLGNDYTSDAVLVGLGPAAVMRLYAVRNGQLALFDLTQAASATNPGVIADGVVSIQAQYGIDTTATTDGAIDEWVEPTGDWAAGALTADQYPRIQAVRLGVVVRSTIQEKPSSDGSCKVTSVAPRALVAGDAVAGAMPERPESTAIRFDADGASKDGCYRYRVYESVIPLRNVVWTSTAS